MCGGGGERGRNLGKKKVRCEDEETISFSLGFLY